MKIACIVLIWILPVTFVTGQTNTFPSTGSVGIGTTSPDYPLHVNGSNNPTIGIGKANANTAGKSTLFFWAGNGSAANGYALTYNKTTITDRLSFVDGGGVENLTLLNGGDIGVGTTAPSLWFGGGKVFEMAYARPVLKLNSTSSTGLSTILFTNASVNAATHNGEFHLNYQYDIADATNSVLKFHSYPAGEMLTLKSNGNVGIGATSPDEKLQVSGKLKIHDKGGDFGLIYHVDNQAETGYNNVWPDQYERALMIKSNAYMDGYGAGGGGFQFWTFDKIEGGAWGSYTGGLKRALTIRRNGLVGIGTANPDEMLTVKGKIHSQEVKVDLAGAVAPDYVFETDYNLLPLSEVESYIQANKHLPEVPSANEMEAEGMNLKEMNLILLKKVEELTLHLVELEKRLKKVEVK